MFVSCQLFAELSIDSNICHEIYVLAVQESKIRRPDDNSHNYC